ncbi:acyltransferase [Vibrio lamellibrachiae]|uniref:acyltransferase family protein n=1 Tax=Vibrio lamellibrachiae TaxID=2910253 RepID=UPI003D098271
MYISVQYLRAFAAILVLLTHTAFKLETHSDNIIDWFNIGTYGVDLFFIISGFIMCLTVERKTLNFSTFMKARFVRILPLYWLLTTVALVIFLVKPSLVNSSGGVTSVWGSYSLIPNGDRFLISNGWTLSYEFFFYLIFSSFLFLGKLQKILTSFSIVFLSVVGLLVVTTNPYFEFVTSSLLLEFVMGILCYEVIKRKIINKKVAVLLILFALLLLIFFNNHGPVDSPLGSSLHAGLPMMMLFLGFVSLESVIPKNKIIYELGMASYSLYLLHPFVLSFVTVVIKALGLSDMPFIYMSAMLIGSCISGWLCYQIVELGLDKKIKAIINKQ